MSQLRVRPAEPSDLAAVAAIYAHYVRTSTATFDVQEPPLSSWQARLDSTTVGDHFLVSQTTTGCAVMPTRERSGPALPTS